jgi:hypothetical protein
VTAKGVKRSRSEYTACCRDKGAEWFLGFAETSRGERHGPKVLKKETKAEGSGIHQRRGDENALRFLLSLHR